MKILKIFTNQYFWLLLIIFFGFWARLYKIDSPIADWHSWRQADTAAVTRNFIKTGFNPLLPKYDDMSGVSENPVINPATFRFVEFPIYNMAVYPLYVLFGVSDIYHRLISVIFSIASIVFIFFIVKKYTGTITALIASFVFAFLPFNVFFGRTTLPEPTFIFFALGMIYFMDRWIWESASWRRGIWGFIFTAIAFLMKPWAIFFYLPLLYSVFTKQNTRKFWIKFIIFTVAALAPFVLWRLWILQQPEGIPASSWLLNSDGIRFRPAFWWWIVSERIGGEILSATGIVLFFIGFISKPKNGNYFLHIWALSAFLFMAVFATGNVRHNYYQTLFVPIASIFFSLGFVALFKGSNSFIPRLGTIIVALILFPLSFYFGFKLVKEFYKVNNPAIVEAGKRADQILPRDAVVLAPYNGDTAFLYQTNRPGFAAEMLPLEELVADYGVGYYISTNRDDKTNWVLRHFQILEDNPRFIIANLQVVKAPLTSEDPEP
ncbi:glycosyltransferase family 39 protein [Candidatus Daviesbacteria bacterium]|nr:glycosyltransferase family 39 protein [Candidatus Daviesbacteria bacterium]